MSQMAVLKVCRHVIFWRGRKRVPYDWTDPV